MSEPSNRCRLVLIVPAHDDLSQLSKALSNALSGGDVASVIVPQRDMEEQAFQNMAMELVPIIQEAGAAALIAGDTRVLGRCQADGLHITGNAEEVYEAAEKYTPDKIVGGGYAKDRHTALSIGDTQPDYLFFGKLDGDIKPEAHRKNLALGQWWSEFVEIPCIVMAGSDKDSVVDVAQTGCDFVAVNKAVFDDLDKAGHNVTEINAMLDEKAPRFVD